jgi:internalin A
MDRYWTSLITFLLLIVCRQAGAALESQAAGERVLHFPVDRSLGRVLICEPVPEKPLEGFHYWIRGEEWEYLAEARGDVTVPAGKWVSLGVGRPEGWRDLSPLSNLPADALYRLDLHGSYTGGAKAGDACMPHLAHLTGLRVLHLSETNITGAGMRWISGLQHLRRLTVPDRIDDAGLAHVAKLPALTGLYFRKNRVTNAGLRYLAGLQALEELALESGRITDSGLVHLARLPRLRYLLLRGDRFTDAGFAHLKYVPSLRILHFGDLSQTTDLGLAHLAQVTGVQDLSFHWSRNITNAGLEYLAKLPHLRSLDIANSKVDDAGLAYLKEVKTLESLDLPNEGISDEGLAHLSQLPRLRELDVSRVHLVDPSRDKGYYTDKGIEALARCTLLEDLGIGSIGVTDASMETIGKLHNLRKLTLFGCTSITDEGLRQLVSLKNLERLIVSGADISISGLSCLNALSNLRYLTIKGVKQDHTGLDLSGLKKLETLAIGTRYEDDPISDADVACLADLTQLTWFQTPRSSKYPRGLTDYGLALLAGLTQMDRLTVGGPKLTDDGLAQLRWMKKLDMLNVYGGTYTSKGLEHLKELEGLVYLTLVGVHDFTRDDIRSLFEALPNLYRVQIGLERPTQTFLRERILTASSRRQLRAVPARPRRTAPRPDRTGRR